MLFLALRRLILGFLRDVKPRLHISRSIQLCGVIAVPALPAALTHTPITQNGLVAKRLNLISVLDVLRKSRPENGNTNESSATGLDGHLKNLGDRTNASSDK